MDLKTEWIRFWNRIHPVPEPEPKLIRFQNQNHTLQVQFRNNGQF